MNRIAVTLLLLAVGGTQALFAQDLRLELPDRTPSNVMSFQGADWLERPERVAEEMPEEVLATLGLEDGDIVADLGSGSGFYTRRMARRVQPSGTVYAVDIQPEMIEILRANMAAEGINNVVPVLSAADDPRLPEGGIDWIFLADVYHELSDPETMLARMSDALRGDGRVALLEYRVEDGTGDHILAAHRMSVRQVMKEWNLAGFELVELHEFLPGQHLFIFGKTGARDESDIIQHQDLLEAMSDGLITATVRGDGRESVGLTVERSSSEPMVVTFPAGTYFAAGAGRSDMVALRDGVVLLTDDEPQFWTAPARGTNPAEAVPGPVDELEIESADDHRPERNVMWVFQGLDFPPTIAPVLEQLALWIVAADVGYDAIAPFMESAPLPAPNGIALALAYVEYAGMDVTGTRVWEERERYLPALSDPSLRTLFEGWERQ
jgi:SAM-dependent methyltransferase